jgi:hypothetical protein
LTGTYSHEHRHIIHVKPYSSWSGEHTSWMGDIHHGQGNIHQAQGLSIMDRGANIMNKSIFIMERGTFSQQDRTYCVCPPSLFTESYIRVGVLYHVCTVLLYDGANWYYPRRHISASFTGTFFIVTRGICSKHRLCAFILYKVLF